MASKRPAPDLSSDATVLYLVPDQPVAGAPARDLGVADLEYLARVRALQASGGIPGPAVSADDINALAAELVATGAFSTKPAAPAEES